jgi:ribosomal protein S24E
VEVKILDERSNPLMHRKEYTFEVDHPGAATPPRAEVRQELAKLVKVPPDRLVIERMNALFGAAKSHGEAVAYTTKEAAEVTVRDHILIRNGLREKPVPAAPGAPAEAPTPPAPKEESKAAPPKEVAEEPAKPEPVRPETPKTEHPRAEHPRAEHPKAEHPKTEHPKSEHPKGEGHGPEPSKESHKPEGHKGDKSGHPEKSDEKAEKPDKPAKHTGKSKPNAESKSEG